MPCFLRKDSFSFEPDVAPTGLKELFPPDPHGWRRGPEDAARFAGSLRLMGVGDTRIGSPCLRALHRHPQSVLQCCKGGRWINSFGRGSIDERLERLEHPIVR